MKLSKLVYGFRRGITDYLLQSKTQSYSVSTFAFAIQGNIRNSPPPLGLLSAMS